MVSAALPCATRHSTSIGELFGYLFTESVENVGVGHLRLRRHQAELPLNGFLRLLDIKQDQPCMVSTQGIGSMERICRQVGKIRCVQDCLEMSAW